VKSTQQQRPVSTLGFSEAKSPTAEVAMEMIAGSLSTVALVDDQEAKDKTDVRLKQVFCCLVLLFYLV